MDDYAFLLSDIENEYIKFFNMIAKKKFNQLKQPCDIALQKIDALKKIIPNNNQEENKIDNFKTELNNSSEIILKPIYLVLELKYSKIYLNILSILKKILAYNLINDIEYIKIINTLKEFFFSTQNEDIQLKVLEILQHIISANLVKLSEDNINNIIQICNIDSIKTHIKSIEIKSAIKLLLNILIKKIFEITEDINVIKFLKQLMTLVEGFNQKEWNNITLQNSLIKSTRLEIICQIMEAFPNKFKQEGDMKNFIQQDMNVFLRKILVMNQDQLIGIKIGRLCLINIIDINANYDILEEVLKYLNKNIQIIKWQKTITLEIVSEIFKKPEILYDIYINNINIYQKLLQSFTNTTYNIIISKSQKLKEKKINIQNNQNANTNNKKIHEPNQLNIIPNKKYIISYTNIFNNESNYQGLVISQSVDYFFKLLTECYISLKNSYVSLIETNGININDIQQNNMQKIILTENQEKIKQMVTYNFTDFKGGLINILLYQNDISTVQSFLSIFQSFIYIYSSFDLPAQKDELLNDLCNLALPNNLQNILEIKEKNILIIRTLFNLSHCTNLLEKNSWKIFIQIVQNLYFILIKNGYYIYNQKQQFDIEIIMKNILTNIKKYSPESTIVEVQKAVQEDEVNKNINNIIEIKPNKTRDKINKKKNSITQLRTLTLEEKENIDILSNLVNNSFTDSNDYDNETLINVIQALYEDIEKKIIFYNKELKPVYENDNNNDNMRKNSVDDAQINNKKEENISSNINNKVNLGKLTMRNPIAKSVMGPKIENMSDMKNTKFNINFQNNIIMMSLSSINFNLVKILEITIINIQRIDLIWDKILSVINLFSTKLNQENDFSETIFKFTIDLLIHIIIHVLLKFNLKKEEIKNLNFAEKNIQSYLLSPILNLLNGYYNNFFIDSGMMVNPLKLLLEKCGTKLDLYGWDSFFKCIDLILFSQNEAKNYYETLFKMIEQIFNEYSDKLSIINIEILLDILEKFSLQLENKNISYSSLSFFWQCTDIIEKYQKKKKEILGLELEYLNEKIKKNENRIKFYENLWKKIFLKLLIINKDKRFDIKKSGINLFSQFFVAKIKTINEINNLSNDIFNEVFLNIFKSNIEGYLLEKTSNNINDININDNEQGKEGNENDSINNNNEEIILFSLQNLGKILKSLIEENKLNNNCYKKILIDFIHKISLLYHDLINKKNSPEISNNILKNLYEFDSGDKIFFQENRNIFLDIIEQIAKYAGEKNFAEKYSKSVKGNKVIQNIFDTYLACFYSKENFDIINKNGSANNNINSLIEIIKRMFDSLNIMNQSLINLDPYSLIQYEKIIFNLIESIGIHCSKFNDVENLINYLLTKIIYIKEDKHSISLSAQSMSSIGIILSQNKNVINNLEEEKIKNLVIYCRNQIDEIYSLKNDKIILDEMAKHNIKKKDKFVWEKMFEYLNDLILKSIINKIKDEKMWDEIINYNIKLYQDLNKENNEMNRDNSEINNNLIKSNEQIQKNIINLIMNILLPNSGNISPNVQQKLLNLFDISDNINNQENDKKLFYLDNMSTENLFNICNFQGEQELFNLYNKSEEKENINKYIEIKKNISNKFLPILFNNCKKDINIFLEAEKNGNDNNELKENVILILSGLKKLDSFCTELEGINKENDILNSCIKNKKGHLFIMQKYLNKLILSKDEKIKKKLYEVYEEIAKQFE